MSVFDVEDGRTAFGETQGPPDRGTRPAARVLRAVAHGGVEGREVRGERTEGLLAGKRRALNREPRRWGGVAVLELVGQA